MLANGGKIGGPSTVLLWVYIVAQIVSILAVLLDMIMTTYKITYQVADDANRYIPDDSDLTSLMTSSSKSSSSGLSFGSFGGILAAGALVLAIMYNRDK